jgi:hypothetical protein
MKAADLKLLERVFDAEIKSAMTPGLPPVAQIKSKRMLVLQEEGLVREMTVTLPGRFPVKVTGWVLTERGRMIYCTNC